MTILSSRFDVLANLNSKNIDELETELTQYEAGLVREQNSKAAQQRTITFYTNHIKLLQETIANRTNHFC